MTHSQTRTALLYDYRGKIAGDYLAQSAEDFGAMPIKDLVPGYRSGT